VATVGGRKIQELSKTFKHFFQAHSRDILPRHVRRFWHHMKKFSHRGRDNFEQLKFKDFQDSLTSNSKTFKTQFGFQEPFKA